jgi:hypothetical protein
MPTKVSERARQILSLDSFNEENDIDCVGNYKLECPFERQYILRMIVRHAHSDWMIPDQLQWLKPLIMMAEEYQKEVIKIKHLCCYVTVRHGLVTSTSDDQWHTDGFSTKISHLPEQNYIVSNCFPTEYVRKAIKFPFDFDPLKHNVHKYLASQINDDDVKTLFSNMVYCMDPYNIHRRSVVPNNVVRTFARVSFTPIEVMDDNNTPNPLLQMPNYNRDGVQIRNRLIDYHSSF